MSGIYFSLLAILVLTGFFLGRSRASAVAGGKLADLHSLPSYHGLFAGSSIFIPMLILFAIGAPLIVVPGAKQRHVAFPGCRPGRPAAARRAAARCRQSRRRTLLRRGDGRAARCGEQLREHPAVGQLDPAGLRRRDRPPDARPVDRPDLAVVPGAQCVRACRQGAADPLRRRRRRSPRSASCSRCCSRRCGSSSIRRSRAAQRSSQFLFGTEWNPQAAMRADQGDIKSAFGFIPLLTGTLLITIIAIAGGRAARPVLGDLPVRVRDAAHSAPSPSRSWRSWPASRPSCSASSPR